MPIVVYDVIKFNDADKDGDIEVIFFDGAYEHSGYINQDELRQLIAFLQKQQIKS